MGRIRELASDKEMEEDMQRKRYTINSTSHDLTLNQQKDPTIKKKKKNILIHYHVIFT